MASAVLKNAGTGLYNIKLKQVQRRCRKEHIMILDNNELEILKKVFRNKKKYSSEEIELYKKIVNHSFTVLTYTYQVSTLYQTQF